MNILITGSNGYLGSVLVQKLITAKTISGFLDFDFKENHPEYRFYYDKIVCYDSLMYKQVNLTDYCYKGDIEFVHGDVRDEVKLAKYVKEADVIIPLAAIVGFPACDKDQKLAWDVNWNQIANILMYARPEAKIIFPNTNSGYGLGEGSGKFCTEETPLKPISVYGKTKCDAERMLLEDGRAVVLRLATVFGASPRMRLDLLVNDFTYKAVKDGYIVLFEKEFKRNFIHIHDVALAFIFAINNFDRMRGQAYNVGLSDTNITKLELAERIKEYIPDFCIASSEIRSDPDKRDYLVSNAKIEALGFKPKYSLRDGIKELIKAYSILLPTNQPYTNL
jgi:nucleoside-diphosphate-sugar epimerase